MTAKTTQDGQWDLAPVFDLLGSFSTPTETTPSTPKAHRPFFLASPSGSQLDLSGLRTPLGDFSQVWEYLGDDITKTGEAQSSQSPTSAPATISAFKKHTDYTSDGAIYRHANLSSTTKGVKWRDEIDGTDLSEAFPEDDRLDPTPSKPPKPSKQKAKQKAKKSKKARKQQSAVSDADSESELQTLTKAPAQKASVHSLAFNNNNKTKTTLSAARDPDAFNAIVRIQNHQKRYTLPAKPVQQTPVEPAEPAVKSPPPTAEAAREAVQRVLKAQPYGPTGSSQKPSAVASQPTANGSKTPQKAENSAATATTSNSNLHSSPAHIVHNTIKNSWPGSGTYRPFSELLPKPNATTTNNTNNNGTATAAVAPHPFASHSSTATHRRRIEPLVVRSGDDRYWALMLKLVHDFYEDRSSLVAPALAINHNTNPQGIHVFVDASNILIGFHEQLRRSRGIPQDARVPRVDLSFASLALLLERRRPTAKRVLVGSTPVVPAFEEAKTIGYETSLLDKVQKAKELTERQKHFPRTGQMRGASTSVSTGGEDSGSETWPSASNPAGPFAVTQQTHAPQKWVEQGVDEIIHLKILESLLDAPAPSTIVLATGDAAEAEYSQGFLRMVERALKRGWRVELVSWSMAISSSYLHRSFRERWGDKFVVVELDDYAEELLEM